MWGQEGFWIVGENGINDEGRIPNRFVVNPVHFIPLLF